MSLAAFVTRLKHHRFFRADFLCFSKIRGKNGFRTHGIIQYARTFSTNTKNDGQTEEQWTSEQEQHDEDQAEDEESNEDDYLSQFEVKDRIPAWVKNHDAEKSFYSLHKQIKNATGEELRIRDPHLDPAMFHAARSHEALAQLGIDSSKLKYVNHSGHLFDPKNAAHETSDMDMATDEIADTEDLSEEQDEELEDNLDEEVEDNLDEEVEDDDLDAGTEHEKQRRRIQTMSADDLNLMSPLDRIQIWQQKDGYVPMEETWEQYQQRLREVEQKYANIDWNRFQNHMQSVDDRFLTYDEEWGLDDIDTSFNFKQIVEKRRRYDAEREFMTETVKLLKIFEYWKMISIQRHVRRTRQGKMESFSVMLMAGDGNGLVSFAVGKGKTAQIAETRAKFRLRRNLLFVPLLESRTIHAPVEGKHGVTRIKLWPTQRGAGRKAGPTMFHAMRCAGIRDATAKQITAHALPRHLAFAAIDCLAQARSVRDLALARGAAPYRLAERGTYEPPMPTYRDQQRRSEEVSLLLAKLQQRNEAFKPAQGHVWGSNMGFQDSLHPDGDFKSHAQPIYKPKSRDLGPRRASVR